MQRAAERCAWLKHMVDGDGIGRILGRWNPITPFIGNATQPLIPARNT